MAACVALSKGDLVKMLLKLVKQKGDKFDHIVIETTGESQWMKVLLSCIMGLLLIFGHLIVNFIVQVLQNLVLSLRHSVHMNWCGYYGRLQACHEAFE